MSEVILGKELTEQEEWLAHIVRQQERERIIKLLETDLVENFADYSDEEECGVKTAIALIKGEQK